MTATTLEGRMAEAYRDGIGAGRDGLLVVENPHDPTSDDVIVRVLAKMWVRGHSEGNSMPDPPENAVQLTISADQEDDTVDEGKGDDEPRPRRRVRRRSTA